MGMYTEFHFNSALRKDVPDQVIDTLNFMLNEVECELPTHELFKEDTRWRFMLRSDSYYFDADAHSTLRYDEISRHYILCIRCSLKNYSQDIEKFVNWISPYLDKNNNDFLGFSRYEETENPTLIFYGQSK